MAHDVALDREARVGDEGVGRQVEEECAVWEQGHGVAQRGELCPRLGGVVEVVV